MKFIILTLFPEMFAGAFDHSIIKKAKGKGLVEIEFVNLRDFATDAYKSVDDHPYGGEKGMILRVDIIDRALSAIKEPYATSTIQPMSILLDPRGTPYTQQVAKTLVSHETIILICGRYEGVDERVRGLVDTTISIGDYVVSGGELPAMMIVDSITRLLPGVLSLDESSRDESFTEGLLEYPQYTRPEQYKGKNVPEILLSGNHQKIKEWRKEKAKELTQLYRPDLLGTKLE